MSPTTKMSILIVGLIFLAFVPPIGVALLFVGFGSIGASATRASSKRRASQKRLDYMRAHLAELQYYDALRKF